MLLGVVRRPLAGRCMPARRLSLVGILIALLATAFEVLLRSTEALREGATTATVSSVPRGVVEHCGVRLKERGIATTPDVDKVNGVRCLLLHADVHNELRGTPVTLAAVVINDDGVIFKVGLVHFLLVVNLHGVHVAGSSHTVSAVTDAEGVVAVFSAGALVEGVGEVHVAATLSAAC